MKKYTSKILFVLFLFTIIPLFSLKAEASSVTIKPSSDILGKKEQFYVDLYLDTEGQDINGIEGVLYFPHDFVSLVRVEDGKSMVDYWVEKAKEENGMIRFSGVMTNGFSGVIDPFNLKRKLPGLILRFVFEGKEQGEFSVYTKGLFVTLNDGAGSVENIGDANSSFVVQGIVNTSVVEMPKETSPEIEAYVIRDPNINNNKHTLIFNAKDEGSGIREVLVKEGLRSWKKIEGPYLLEDQSRHSIITLQATNYSGASIAMRIDPLSRNIFTLQNIITILIFITILFLLTKKIYEKNKKL